MKNELKIICMIGNCSMVHNAIINDRCCSVHHHDASDCSNRDIITTLNINSTLISIESLSPSTLLPAILMQSLSDSHPPLPKPSPQSHAPPTLTNTLLSVCTHLRTSQTIY